MEDVEIDYVGDQVTLGNFLNLLSPLSEKNKFLPSSQKISFDGNTDLFVYLTGHGGDGFLKIKDQEELTQQALSGAFEILKAKNLYKKLFFVIDTVILYLCTNLVPSCHNDTFRRYQ